MMNTIWIYWENLPGRTPPPHILLCREVLEYQCKKCSIILVTPDTIDQFLPDLPHAVWDIRLDNPKHNPIAVRCAFIRAFLLEKYGGLYVDADCIALKDYIDVFSFLELYDFVAMRRTSAKTNHISIGFLASRKKGVIITEYANKLRSILSQKSNFQWGEVGAYAITPIVDTHPDKAYIFREDQIHPVVAEEQFKFCDERLEPADGKRSGGIQFSPCRIHCVSGF